MNFIETAFDILASTPGRELTIQQLHDAVYARLSHLGVTELVEKSELLSALKSDFRFEVISRPSRPDPAPDDFAQLSAVGNEIANRR